MLEKVTFPMHTLQAKDIADAVAFLDGLDPSVVVPETSALDPSVKRTERVVRVFLADAQRDISALQAAVAAADAKAVKSTAHRLKGGCLAIGLPRMASVCVQLEASPPNGAELFLELGREFERVKGHLEASLAS